MCERPEDMCLRPLCSTGHHVDWVIWMCSIFVSFKKEDLSPQRRRGRFSRKERLWKCGALDKQLCHFFFSPWKWYYISLHGIIKHVAWELQLRVCFLIRRQEVLIKIVTKLYNKYLIVNIWGGWVYIDILEIRYCTNSEIVKAYLTYQLFPELFPTIYQY